MWERKGNCGTLPARMPNIQRAEEKVAEGSRRLEYETGQTVGRPKTDQACDGICE